MPRPKLTAAIDIGSSKIVTVIAATSQESERLNVVGVSSVSSRGIKKSQVVDIEEAIASITESVEAAERMAGYPISSAFIAVGGEHVQSQNSKGVVAVGNPEGEIIQDDIFRVIEAARAVSLPSSREILHVIPREFIVDSQGDIRDPLGMTGVRLETEAHLITGSTAVIRNLTKCVEDLGIDIEDLVFSGLASSQSVLSETEKELGVVLVDIGGGTTSITVFADSALSYSSVLPIGAKNITNDLAIGLRVSLESAEKIKKHLTELKTRPRTTTPQEDTPPRSQDEINLSRLGIAEDIKTASRKTLEDGIIRPRLNEIFDFVGQELEKSGFAGSTPAGVVITGGGAQTTGVLRSCKSTLQLPARIGEPSGLSGLVDEIKTPAYSSVSGLILYGATQEPSTGGISPDFTQIFKKLPGKGSFNKALTWLKSLLA